MWDFECEHCDFRGNQDACQCRPLWDTVNQISPSPLPWEARASSGFQISLEMKGRGFNGEKRSTEDRRFILRTCAMKQNLARYFPAVPTYTPAEDGAASEGQKVRATREGTKIYRAWVPMPGVGLDSFSLSILASSPAWNTVKQTV